MVEGVDYFVRLVDFPSLRCGGLVMVNDDGTYTVLLNSRLSYEQNRKSMDHELAHMEHGDFYRDEPLEIVEREAG